MKLAGIVAAGVALLAAHDARAACAGRPTDAGGYQGYDYGAAEVRSYATSRVRVHYATSGTHAPMLATTRGDGVPDTVAFAGDTAETALAKFSELGFKSPPGDGACTSNGGDDKLDIYLVAFAGADGSTAPESCTGRACSSFMLVEATFTGRGYKTAKEGFQTVVTHELFHAVQNAYDQEMDRFWAEGTAQWAMKQVFPDLLDFEQQLPAFFSQPSRSIDTAPSGVTAGYLYGSSVWPLFLDVKFGAGTVRAIFEAEVDGTKAIPAADGVLAGKGSSIAAAFPTFWAWNAATKTYAGGGGYPDAAKYPGVKLAPLEDGASAVLSGLGAYAYLAQVDAPASLSIEGDPARVAGLVVPVVDGKAKLDDAKALPADLSGQAIVIVTGITTKKTDAPFTLRFGQPGVTPAPAGEGGGGDDGGCAIGAPARGAGARGSVAAALAAALALSFASRRRARRG